MPTFHNSKHLTINLRATGRLSGTWNFPLEVIIRELGFSLSPVDPNVYHFNLVLALERLKLVPYCVPDVGIGRGGVAGIGLNPIGEEVRMMLEASSNSLLADESGKLRLVRLFAMFKLALDAHYRTIDKLIPGNQRDPGIYEE